MTMQELINKYKCITHIDNFNDVINITIELDIKYRYAYNCMDLEFKTLEECDKYLDENYLKIKYKAMELILKEQSKKIYNQSKTLHNLNKCYLKIKKGEINPLKN